MRRVVVTGMGIISSIGNSLDEVTESLRAAKPGIVFAEDYAELGFRSQVKGDPRLDPFEILDRRVTRFMGKGAALAGLADPGQEEPGHLPDGIEPQAPGHHRVADEMALEEPQVRIDVEFGPHLATTMGATVFGDRGDAVEHQHGRSRQACITLARQLATAVGQQFFVVKCVLPLGHGRSPLSLKPRLV